MIVVFSHNSSKRGMGWVHKNGKGESISSLLVFDYGGFQVELCRKVIRLVQDVVLGSVLDRSTWDFLLLVLLYHTWDVFNRKDSSLARELAAPLLKVW